MATFDVNTDESIKLTVKLNKLHRSAFPVAVRGTLNDAAFETKKNVPKVANRKFTTRQKSFFRAFSTVDKAKGFDLRNMRATSGINSAKGDEVAEGLEAQEFGGTIMGRKLIPMDSARTSNSHAKKLRKKNQFRQLGKTVRMRSTGGRGTRKSRFVASVMKANSLGAKNMIITTGGRGTLYRISGVSQSIRTRKIKFKMQALYHYRNTKFSRVQPSPFMEPSATLAAKKMDKFYKKQADRQFKRLLK